jgi:electron transfer flavoprotein alpha subunit
VVIVLRPTGLALPEGEGAAAITRVESAPDPARVRTRHLAYEEAPAGGVDLTKAPFIVTVGRGIGDRDNLAIFEELATKAGGALGSSRPLVDAGWMPRDRQVGQSGTTVKPSIYLAFGVSGANEHLAGMKESGTIIAVNTDPRARIFDVAHVGAVADACEVAEGLLKAL